MSLFSVKVNLRIKIKIKYFLPYFQIDPRMSLLSSNINEQNTHSILMLFQCKNFTLIQYNHIAVRRASKYHL